MHFLILRSWRLWSSNPGEVTSELHSAMEWTSQSGETWGDSSSAVGSGYLWRSTSRNVARTTTLLYSWKVNVEGRNPISVPSLSLACAKVHRAFPGGPETSMQWERSVLVNWREVNGSWRKCEEPRESLVFPSVALSALSSQISHHVIQWTFVFVVPPHWKIFNLQVTDYII